MLVSIGMAPPVNSCALHQALEHLEFSEDYALAASLLSISTNVCAPMWESV